MPHRRDSARLFAQRHGLSAVAERELVDLLGATSSGERWIPDMHSTTLTRSGGESATLMTANPGKAWSGPQPAEIPFFERYDDLGVIGIGGMGEVRRVHDRLLQRTLAVKLLRWDCIEDADARERFLAEAQVNAQLQHPGVLAVHDQGVLPDGRPWFTMKEVRGRTLREALRVERPDPAGSTPRRLVDVLARVCRTVAYAHAKGVVHRDIKPANIMLGEFGEVLVMDWGIARVGVEPTRPPAPTDPPAAEQPVRRTASTTGGTRRGRVMGTPAFMAPEQARGDLDAIGPPCDVHALGAVLYLMLTGRPPYTGRSSSVVAQVIQGPPPGIDAIRPRAWGPAPRDLVAIAERAMRREPRERPTAAEMAAEIEGWLDGVLKATRARAIVAEADAMLPRIEALRREVVELERQAAAMLEPLPDHTPHELKRSGWALEDAARARSHQAELTEARMLQTLRSALNVAPDLPEAHERLATFYQQRLLAAERRRDARTAAIYEDLVRTHDQGRLCEWLAGDGRLTLVTDPPGARVTALRFEERDRRQHLVPEGELGRTPLRGVPLARGSHLLVIEAEGRPPVRYPVDIDRGGHWDGLAPGATEPQVIRLPAAGELGPDDVYVPAGWCIVGGDDDAVDALSRRRVWIDGFVIEACPVTNAQYLAFVDDVAARRGRDAIRGRLPRELDLVGREAPGSIYVDAPGGGFALGVDQRGWRWQPTWPVVAVDWHDATAYAQWYGAARGAPWRLCHGFEHEKAARGVDGRTLPWGDHFDHTWANVINSREGPPILCPVGRFETDRSVYGVYDTVGNTRVWCVGAYRREGDVEDGGRLVVEPAAGDAMREVRGGSWHGSPNLGRIAGRFGTSPDRRYPVLGLRLVRPYP